jgi:hypothetical protein
VVLLLSTIAIVLVLGAHFLLGKKIALGVVALPVMVATVLGLPAAGVPTGHIPAGLPNLERPSLVARRRGNLSAGRRMPAACLEGVSVARARLPQSTHTSSTPGRSSWVFLPRTADSWCKAMCLKQQELTAMCSTKACHREAALRNRCWWTARKASAWQSWGRVEIMGRQRTKSADLAWPPQFGARPVACKGFGPKGWFVRPRRGSATVASPTKLRRQTNAAGASSRKAVTIPASFDARLQASASRS